MGHQPDIVTMRLPNASAPIGKRFDYKGMHRYIITLPTRGVKPAFVHRERVLTVLNKLRDVSREYHFDLVAYCFLPKELVLIVRGKEESSDMKRFLSAFRAGASEAVQGELSHALWKKKYQERVLRKTEPSKDAAYGIFQLPVKAGLVADAAQYEFQGSFVLSHPLRSPREFRENRPRDSHQRRPNETDRHRRGKRISRP